VALPDRTSVLPTANFSLDRAVSASNIEAPWEELGAEQSRASAASSVRGGNRNVAITVRLDEDGFLFIVERNKELIIRGFNVSPREVEDMLYAHSKVAEAAVVGFSVPLMGEDVRAWVAPKPGVDPTADEVIAFGQEPLAKSKCSRGRALRGRPGEESNRQRSSERSRVHEPESS